ncbi:SET domain-containing protein-lysine N-methyltransferase [soil metagenome]
MIKHYLYLNQSAGKGKGVFTKEKIPAGIIIEESPVIVMDIRDREHLDQTLLHDYIFEWGDDLMQCCMALGWVPMYNHSYKSNCEYFMDFDEHLIQIKTVRVIQNGEELTINYNGSRNDEKPLWFNAQ